MPITLLYQGSPSSETLKCMDFQGPLNLYFQGPINTGHENDNIVHLSCIHEDLFCVVAIGGGSYWAFVGRP